MEKSPTTEELLARILELEERHVHMKQEISKLSRPKPDNQSTACPHQLDGPLAIKLTETQYLNILHSMGQALFIYDVQHRIIFW
jgi:hypothetical protein